jgi:hypothetical protein
MNKLILDEIMAEMREKTDHYGLIAVNWVHGILYRHRGDLDPDRKLLELRDWCETKTNETHPADPQSPAYYEMFDKIDEMLEDKEEPEPEPEPEQSDLERRVAELERKAAPDAQPDQFCIENAKGIQILEYRLDKLCNNDIDMLRRYYDDYLHSAKHNSERMSAIELRVAELERDRSKSVMQFRVLYNHITELERKMDLLFDLNTRGCAE